MWHSMRLPVQDPVANFHLRNGASIAHLHWGADLSSRGRAGSYGIMVNYECADSHCPPLLLPPVTCLGFARETGCLHHA